MKLILLIFLFSNFAYSSDLNITIEVDGSNLPSGEGDILEGKKLFSKNCSFCHGHFGQGLIAPELVSETNNLKGKNISKTVGNFWPYAPKIFDFIRRAKRDSNGDYFDNNQVYSLTGYLLKLNKIKIEMAVNKKVLSNIIMPNRDGFISSY